MDWTPKKANNINNHVMQTPDSKRSGISSVGRDDDCDYLMETFSGMKINNQAGALKRSADLMTVEGSPVNLTKRIDMNQTPHAKFLLTSCLQASFVGEEIIVDVNNAIASKDSAIASKDSAAMKIASVTGSVLRPRKVLIISSVSDDHDTGNHQENALRTALLCGSNGCLRRGQLGTDFCILRVVSCHIISAIILIEIQSCVCYIL